MHVGPDADNDGDNHNGSDGRRQLTKGPPGWARFSKESRFQFFNIIVRQFDWEYARAAVCTEREPHPTLVAPVSAK